MHKILFLVLATVLFSCSKNDELIENTTTLKYSESNSLRKVNDEDIKEEDLLNSKNRTLFFY